MNALYKYNVCCTVKEVMTKDEQRLVLKELVKDVYKGYNDTEMIQRVLDKCGVDQKTWDQIQYAYKLYKHYETIEAPQHQKQLVH